MTRLTDNPTKKPVASIGFEEFSYLKAAAGNQLAKVENTKFTDKHEWEKEHERLRSLVRRLKLSQPRAKDAGVAWWVPLLVATALALVFLAWLIFSQPKAYTFFAPQDGAFQVLNRYDAYHYRFNHVGSGALNVTFCPNYEPQLSAGQTIWWISFLDRGKCWDIQPKGYGYKLVRDSAGKPILAPNCFAGPEVVKCEPNPTEARF